MPVEETENEIRVRVRQPDEFKRIAQIWPDKQDAPEADYPYNEQGIRAIGGPLKTSGKLEAQAYRFSLGEKYKWTPEKAEQWVRDHDETPKSISSPTTPVGFTYDMDIKVVKAATEIPEPERITGLPKGLEAAYIEGAANTEETDREGDVIDQASIDVTDFQKNPVLLFQHEPKSPVGRVLKVEENAPLIWDVDQWRKAEPNETPETHGLWVRAAVIGDPKDPESILTKVKQKILRAFSIRGKAQRRTRLCDKFGTWRNVLTGLKLYEISIVSVPANQGSIFSVVKSLLDNSPGSVAAETNKEEPQMEPDKSKAPPAAAPPAAGQESPLSPALLQRLEAVEAQAAKIAALEQEMNALKQALATMQASAAAPPKSAPADPAKSETAEKGEPVAGKVTVQKGMKKSQASDLTHRKAGASDELDVQKAMDIKKKLAAAAWYKQHPV